MHLPIQRIIFNGATVQAGIFRCLPACPLFHDSGPIKRHLVVFPRTSVSITHAGSTPIVADPNVVMFYNRGQRYRRGRLSERGDLCDWYAFEPAIIAEALAPFDPAVAERPQEPFALTHGPSDAAVYMQQRRILQDLLGGSAPDSLYVEEALLHVLGQIVARAYRTRGQPAGPAASAAGAVGALVYDLKSLLALRFTSQLSLQQAAGALHCSPFHLCRIFRRTTGSTIHAYLNQLRLRSALELVAQSSTDLTTLGIELGFSSHSHFTREFRRAFGVVPSAFRRTASARRVRELSKIMIA